MTVSKRDFLKWSAAAGSSTALSALAQAKPLFDTINMFVPAAPGGGWDGTARIWGLPAAEIGRKSTRRISLESAAIGRDQ